MVFRRLTQSTELYTYLVVGLLLIMTGCGARESTTIRPCDMVSEEGDRTGQAPTIVQTTAMVPSPSPTPDIYLLYGDAGYIQALREELTRTDLPEEARASQQARLDQAKFEASMRATAQVGPTAVRRGRPAAVQEVRPTSTPGISDTAFNGIKGIRIANVWNGPVDGIWTKIHAGSEEADWSQGLLYFRAVSPTEAPIEVEVYRTPTKNGIVKIIAKENEQLTLEAEDGTLFVFDIPSRMFVEP